MEIAKIVLLVLHFIGIASLLGSFLVQIKDVRRGEGRVLAGMFHGALTMLVTGLALVAIAEMGAGPVNHAKIAVKLLVLVAILVLVLVYRKKERIPAWVLWAIGGLSIVNIVLAVAW
ncbi:MAG: hypothetical protein Q4E05_00385 [Pseudoclavibacter sp.]|nr:hypothetical protein [Pseudoclavibacter sp.]